MFGLIMLACISASADQPEQKAADFLAREVAGWSREHRCFSCHNDGEGAAGLFRAGAAGVMFDRRAIAATAEFLANPEAWDANGPGGPARDDRLARVVFASALASALESGRGEYRGALDRAAERLARDQANDGSWPIEDGGSVGSPAAYGRPLATSSAARTLLAADPKKYAAAAVRARAWLDARPVGDVVSAAAVLMIRRGDELRDPPAHRALDYLSKAQAPDGAWGPHPETPTEPFDTAVALIALAQVRDQPEAAERLRRGRRALVAMQLDDGSWPETTRPAGGRSYAQQLATTGWALRALLISK